MPGEQIPEVWVGESVNVGLPHDDEPLEGKLVEVNDRGLVLQIVRVYDFSDDPEIEYDGEVEGTAQNFFPWGGIAFVQRTTEVRPLHEDRG